jgi:hypothetical protein
LLSGCTAERDGAVVPVVDLARKLGEAERRPLTGAFELGEFTFAGHTRASIVVPAESRLTWKLRVPHRGTLRLHAAVPPANGPAAAVFRVGMSDNRRYDTVIEQTITSDQTASRGWIAMAADLSRYAGRKFSLFFRPDEIQWRVVVATHVVAGSPGVVYLGEPAITTDVDGAREYVHRALQQEKQ